MWDEWVAGSRFAGPRFDTATTQRTRDPPTPRPRDYLVNTTRVSSLSL
jgi:hypothetical protein